MSGIYIPNMEMPTSCAKCPCSNDETRYCHAANKYIPMFGKPQFCPLVPVPPHGRLIDADALIKAKSVNYIAILMDIADAPTIILADGKEGE